MNRSFCSAVALSAFTIVIGLPPASADEVADAGPAPVNCAPPEGPLLLKAPKAEIAKNQQRIDEYKTCVNAYQAANITKARELQAQAQNLQTQAQASAAQAQATQARAQAYATAANNAVDAFNTYVNNLNAQAGEPQKK